MALFATIVVTSPLFLLLIVPFIGSGIGWLLRRKTDGRRIHLINLMEEEHRKYLHQHQGSDSTTPDKLDANGELQATQDWQGVVGFFHPFCNAGGGGERVLWAAIRATQDRWPRAKCFVYTGDHDVPKDAIIARVKNRFNIQLHAPTVQFLYLSKRNWVLASRWPVFTLLGQSLGSIVLAWDAFSLMVPDIFIDTMGYAFALSLSKFLFRSVPTGAYVHYPTISTDMLESLDPTSSLGSQGVNAGKGTGARGAVKKIYWRLFAALYSWVGSSIDVVMTNSTWTQAHVKSLWGPYRLEKDREHPIAVVYPPVAVSEFEHEVEVSAASEKQREPVLIYIAQFRPEKNHPLIIQSFADFVKTKTPAAEKAQLVLIGSVRDDSDSKRVYRLRLMVNELGIKDHVQFHINASWSEILEWSRKASVGVNGMWNEHFGIGVVEYQAAGLISVVHDSGGPKLDIVTKVDGEPTGFHASNAAEFAAGYEAALSLPDPLAMRLRARKSAKRFSEEVFEAQWLSQMGRLVALGKRK
ncbi:glycosyltransferase family 4 protein [Trichoderma atroviride IMI 206040]|uniref:GDP-Man:Man(3)GlcNAc(2)-PP-Dol alpha-1,2-mannosyltransferase n=1 Tax=Hypocrea atroviridis (strain ATCC 20476 / IMI 206040) TaxID=452589 RepID=G9NWU5_HYPAI|nr:glycosyltransferase family 4 protein [Trichoderma atroviride IMI 206040]EHK45433.1 glycosyltransferase family 4 protein [Trichoderma atroviride IMI 206040]